MGNGSRLIAIIKRSLAPVGAGFRATKAGNPAGAKASQADGQAGSKSGKLIIRIWCVTRKLSSWTGLSLATPWMVSMAIFLAGIAIFDGGNLSSCS